MSHIAVVGGHGQVARHLHPFLVAAGHTPVALIRKESQRASLEALGAEVQMLDIEQDEADAFAASFAGCDAVVFAAGGGAYGDIERKRTVDLGGALKSIEGARSAGVSRFVMISAIGVDDPIPDDIAPVWKAYVEAKRDADAALRESDLAWTVLRPGRLTDDEGTGQVAVGDTVERAEIPRQDVAAVVAAVLDDEGSVGKQWNVVSGDASVAEAVAAAGRA